jgi:predicted peptidase
MVVKTLLLALGLHAVASAQADKFLVRTQKGKSGLNMGYRLFVPAGYDKTKKYPVVLALHGSGERGSNNTIQLTANQLATAWVADTLQARVPHFVVAPQCPAESTWVQYGKRVDAVPFSGTLKIVLEIMDSLEREYSLDKDREYVVGLSMGGYASWDLTVRFPDRFAAAVPICGWGDTTKAARIKDLPIWAFHGDKDPTVNVSGSRDMIAALNRAGGHPKYTEYPGVFHDSWVKAMKEPGLPPWVFQQKRAPSTGLIPQAAIHPVPSEGRLHQADGRSLPTDPGNADRPARQAVFPRATGDERNPRAQ